MFPGHVQVQVGLSLRLVGARGAMERRFAGVDAEVDGQVLVPVAALEHVHADGAYHGGRAGGGSSTRFEFADVVVLTLAGVWRRVVRVCPRG